MVFFSLTSKHKSFLFMKNTVLERTQKIPNGNMTVLFENLLLILH
jgi:hypothetical protein